MFQFYADKNKLTVRQREPLTSGSVNAYEVRFQFSEDWDGLERTAVFKAGGEPVPVLLDASGVCQIPWETLVRSGVHLRAGVCGTRDGAVVLPTVWADCGFILEGAGVPEAGSWPPTPELWRQALAGKGDSLEYTWDGALGLYAGDKLLSAIYLSGESEGPDYGVGHGLKVEEGKLAVDTAEDFSGDNTLPITAAAVQAAVGNIEILLGTI